MQKLDKKKKQSKLKSIIAFMSFMFILGVAGGIEQADLELFPALAMATIAGIVLKICMNEYQ